MKQHVKVNDYDPVILSNNQPDGIEARILEILKQNEIEHESDADKYKIKFTFTYTGQEKEDAWMNDKQI